jgi:hypothetical protein
MTFGDPFRKQRPVRAPRRADPQAASRRADWEEPAADMLAAIASPTLPKPQPVAASSAIIATRSNRCGKLIGAFGRRVSIGWPTATENCGSSAMSDCLPHLLDDDEVAHLLGYRNAKAFRRRREQLEKEGFPKRRPIVKRYSPMEVREWIDGKNGLQSGSDPLLKVAGKWGA